MIIFITVFVSLFWLKDKLMTFSINFPPVITINVSSAELIVYLNVSISSMQITSNPSFINAY